jgi:hypothetical protein
MRHNLFVQHLRQLGDVGCDPPGLIHFVAARLTGSSSKMG